jgi:hypothetical protein
MVDHCNKCGMPLFYLELEVVGIAYGQGIMEVKARMTCWFCDHQMSKIIERYETKLKMR